LIRESQKKEGRFLLALSQSVRMAYHADKNEFDRYVGMMNGDGESEVEPHTASQMGTLGFDVKGEENV